ncbi:bis(5'-adenosyl)-triphosphatase isoform X1 [Gracilaria domingensis]|nr:bis(5'-adenosyl)-triphosphatase isoform X1 [Gracilaria domingensis]
MCLERSFLSLLPFPGDGKPQTNCTGLTDIHGINFSSIPGHCLVVSRRVAARVADLTSEELADLWKVACSISKPLEQFYKAEALTFALQDGPVAGQTVPHVHIHILPRRTGDFEINNDVYREIEKNDLSRKIKIDAEEERKPRSLGEMAEEARTLRTLFRDSLPIPSE